MNKKYTTYLICFVDVVVSVKDLGSLALKL